MKKENNIREKILNSPSYWVEGINGLIYDAIVSYMDKHDMKRQDLAKHLDVSKGRVSQILNDGEINFSLEKIVEIALKVDKYPNFLFEDKAVFIEKERKIKESKAKFFLYNVYDISTDMHVSTAALSKKGNDAKVIQFNNKTTSKGTLSVLIN